MWSLFRYAFISIVLGCLVSTTTAQAQLLLGSLLGDKQNNNNNNPNMPLIGALGLGSNQQSPSNTNYNQYSNNYPNNNNANRNLLSALGGNANVNRPITNSLNNFNRYPNTGQTNPNNNVNNIKNQMKEAEKLLERLKELNKLKEQQKLEKEKESQGQAGTGSDNPKTDNGDDENINIKDDHEKTNVLKSLTKKKFYFMVRPVVPENEAVKYEQTVYYEE